MTHRDDDKVHDEACHMVKLHWKDAQVEAYLSETTTYFPVLKRTRVFVASNAKRSRTYLLMVFSMPRLLWTTMTYDHIPRSTPAVSPKAIDMLNDVLKDEGIDVTSLADSPRARTIEFCNLLRTFIRPIGGTIACEETRSAEVASNEWTSHSTAEWAKVLGGFFLGPRVALTTSGWFINFNVLSRTGSVEGWELKGSHGVVSSVSIAHLAPEGTYSWPFW